jgi:hypothetical protein
MTFPLAAFLAVRILHKMDIYHSSALQATEITSGYLAGTMSTYAWLRDPIAQSVPCSHVMRQTVICDQPLGVTPQLPR